MIFALHCVTGIGPICSHSTRESSLNPILTPFLSFQQSTQWKARPMTVVFPARHRLEVQASCKPQAAQHFMTWSWKPYIWSNLHVDPYSVFVIAYGWSVETKAEAGLAHLVEEQKDFLKHKWKALWSKKKCVCDCVRYVVARQLRNL